jgi:hypothetical protein
MMILDPYRFGDGASGFRYLHDEISGGLFAYSHLKTLAAYSGSSINIQVVTTPTDYGFINNIMDLAQINTDNSVDATVNTIYDQFEINDFDNGSGVYDKSENELMQSDGLSGKFISGSTGNLSTHTGACTIITVSKHTAASFKSNEYLYSGNSISGFRFVYTNGSTFLLRVGASPRLDCNNVAVTFDNNIHMLVGTYDGSETAAGLKVYEDDMTTALSSSNSETGTYTNDVMFNNRNSIGYGGSTSGTDFQGLIYETHIFNKELSETERETAKEILEQYYTF